jgi:hypothetical protein
MARKFGGSWMRAGNPKIAYKVFSGLGKIAEVECAGVSSHSRPRPRPHRGDNILKWLQLFGDRASLFCHSAASM